MLIRVSVLALTLACAAALPAAAQQTPPQPPTTPARFLSVHAPYAQQLLLQAKAQHPELKKIGLHAIAPGETESAIIANPITSKIGKVSSAHDLTVVTAGKPTVVPHLEEEGFFDLGLPMPDAQGRPIGMMVMEIPYRAASSPDTALQLGLRIRDEIAARIPDKDSLFQAAAPGVGSAPFAGRQERP